MNLRTVRSASAILALLLLLAAPTAFAGHEFMEAFIQMATQTEQATCATNGTVYTKYESADPQMRYTMETLVFSSGEMWYLVTFLGEDSPQSQAFFRSAESLWSGNLEESSVAEFEARKKCS